MLDELRERVRTAHDNHRPLRLRGSGTKDFYGEDPGDGPNPSDSSCALTPASSTTSPRNSASRPAVVRLWPKSSGHCKHNQFLAFEPPTFGGDPTIGGVIATGLSGPRRMYAGAARDFVLGVTLLDGRGEPCASAARS